MPEAVARAPRRVDSRRRDAARGRLHPALPGAVARLRDRHGHQARCTRGSTSRPSRCPPTTSAAGSSHVRAVTPESASAAVKSRIQPEDLLDRRRRNGRRRFSTRCARPSPTSAKPPSSPSTPSSGAHGALTALSSGASRAPRRTACRTRPRETRAPRGPRAGRRGSSCTARSSSPRARARARRSRPARVSPHATTFAIIGS